MLLVMILIKEGDLLWRDVWNYLLFNYYTWDFNLHKLSYAKITIWSFVEI